MGPVPILLPWRNRMSLPHRALPTVPEETAALAHAAFPQGHPLLTLRDTLGPLFGDTDFLDVYGHTGPAALSPAMVALATLLQYAEGLADEAAAHAVASRLDWKYVLSLPPGHAGFDPSVFSDFRKKLVAGSAEERLFRRLLEHARAQGLLKERGAQRTDSTHVLAAITRLNRLELVGETMRQALNVLAVVAPSWLRAHSDPTWLERYGPRYAAIRLPPSETARMALAETIGQDGQHLLGLLAAEEVPAALRELEAIVILRTVWQQQYDQQGETIRWRPSADLPPSGEVICSPYDPDARWSEKRGEGWAGYKYFVTEQCDPDVPLLLTHVETSVATIQDAARTAPIQEALVAQGTIPDPHLLDRGFVTMDGLAKAAEPGGMRITGPTRPDPSWQAREQTGYDQTHFDLDWEQQQARCPQGKTSATWREKTDRRGEQVIQIHFRKQDCKGCPAQARCTRGERRTLEVRSQAHHAALQAAREREGTPEFWQAYRARAGIEGAISQAVRRGGLRRTR